MSVIILSSIGIAIGTAILLIGLGSSKSRLALEHSNQAKGLVNACAEEALNKIRASINFSGSGSLILGQGSCNYEVINLGGQNREVRSSANISGVVRKVKILINQINPKINATSWQEVADF